jgi:hypothetical protein
MKGLGVFLGRLLRGARIVELMAFLFLVGLVVWVYSEKARAGRQRAEIAAVESQIQQEQRQVRLLKAEVAHMERPEQLQRFSAALNLGPVPPKHEATLADLPMIAQGALTKDKAAARPAGASTQTGFEGHPELRAPAPAAPKPLVTAANDVRSGAPQ